MTKTYTLVITTTGDGTEAKAEELIDALAAKIADMHSTLGNIQADVELVEVEN